MTQAKTPFKRAGYTKDSKFRVTSSYGDFEKGDVVILRKDDGTHSPQFVLVNDPDIWEFMDLDDELELIVEQEVGITTYPNSPHKHAELIKQWADGAEIEYWSTFFLSWFAVEDPSWTVSVEYRVKPQKSEKDIQIEKLEADFKLSCSKAVKSWEDYMQQTYLMTDLANKLQELKSNV